MSELDSWEFKFFDECIEKVSYSKKIPRKIFLDSGKFPIVSQEQGLINGYWNDPDALFKIKKPVVLFGDHTQVLKYIDFDFVIGADGVKILQPTSDLETKYFYYFLTSVEIKDLGYARHYRLLSEIFVPVPPLPEQQRIVAMLDETFAAFNTVHANAARNAANAREVFEAVLREIFANGEGWEEKRIDAICENLDSKRVPVTKKDRKEGKYPYYGASGIVDYVDDFLFDEDLLLVSEDGANLLARTYPIAFSISGQTWVNNHAHVLRFENMATRRFVEYYLNSIPLDDYVGGMAQPKLNQSMLNSILVPFPPLAEQRAIVARLDALAAETSQLQANYQRKVEQVEELKKSVLQKAFTR